MNRMIALFSRFAVALLIGQSTMLPAQAQNLADALEQAWSRNPLATASTAREDEARARAEVAASLTPGPASMSLSNLNDRLGTNRGKQEWEIEIAAPLWLPGQKAARLAEAASAQNEVSARRHALRLQIAGELRDAWWSIANARNAVDLASRRIVTARSLESDVLRRFKVGELARIDANLAQNERLSSEAELADAQALLRQAEQAYRGLTGVAAPAVLVAENSPEINGLSADHPKLAAAAATSQLARARLRLAEQSRRDSPQIAVRVARDRTDLAESYSNAIGVKLTIPFSSGPRIRQQNSAASAELAQADAELALAKMSLELDRERVLRDRDATKGQLDMARQRRELGADTLRLAEKSFALGESDLTALLRARAAAFEAEAVLARQQIALAATQSRINQIQGVLP